MANRFGSYDALDGTRHITGCIRITNVWRLRLGCFLLRLAGRVMRSSVEVTTRAIQEP